MARRSAPGLDVWLYGHKVARVSEPTPFRYRLDFTEEALDIYGVGSRILSLSLPFATKPVRDSPTNARDRKVSAFLEGLLPEGNLRSQIATQAAVSSQDTMALLRLVGVECAGAVQFLAEGHVPHPGIVRPLTKAEVDRLIADLPTYHLPDGSTPQASLAGIQDKVLLTELPDGGWGWPTGGAASSHLVKPEPTVGVAVAHLVQAEEWALRVARRTSLPVPEARLESFDGRDAIVVRRYDRVGDGVRVHQEDFCQALGLGPQAKYESTAEYSKYGSRLSRIARLAADRAPDPEEFRVSLLSAVTFNVIIGNSDAHSKNYSILIGNRGEVMLAPLYDVAPVMYLDSRYRGTGHVLNGRTNVDWVEQSDLVYEARSWGLSERKASATVRDVMEKTYDSVGKEELPEGAESVADRLKTLWHRQGWAVAHNAAFKTARSSSIHEDELSPASES